MAANSRKDTDGTHRKRYAKMPQLPNS
jgi:hypothetical protein